MADSSATTRPTTVPQMREWLKAWVSHTTDLPREEISEEQPLEGFGLSSRDVVVLSGDLERLLGVTLDATVAYEFNTIASLSEFLINGRSHPSGKNSSDLAATQARQHPLNRQLEHDIAIVGMAGRFPGAANTKEMWDMFLGYKSGVGDVPAGRWTEYAEDEEITRQMSQARLTGGYIEDIASFDAEFFGLSPLEAANMDPQQRMVLQLTWEALEHAHIPANTLRGTAVGVFMGTTNNDYGMLISADPKESHPYALTGNSSSIVANRVSYTFDFRGPSVALDTACSSSLVAIHQAVRSLREGESTVAIAGGVNLLANPFATLAFSQLGVLSPTGGIHAFSSDADGIVRSDGAGVLVLKRLSDAQHHGDTILAVIKGSAVNSDGRSNGLTAPNPEAQVDVLRAAYADAGIDPTLVDYVEAHGTGTILGDPIEATALGAVLGKNRQPGAPALLGSAKTNFGHTEAAAGVAGVIKVIMAMQEGIIPPSINYAGPNPYIDFEGERLEVVEDAREWPEYSGRPVAGVSGFGFGGTNAHVVLAGAASGSTARHLTGISHVRGTEAAPLGVAEVFITDKAGQGSDSLTPSAPDDATPGESPDNSMPYILAVSGLLPSRRRQAAADMVAWLEEQKSANNPPAIADIARALAGHNHGRSRAVALAKNLDEAMDGMRRIAEGKTTGKTFAADAPEPTGSVWVYSGFGSQHRKMGKDLYQLSPFFAQRIRAIDQRVQEEVGWSLVEKILDDEQTYDLETAQVGITCIQIALTDLMKRLGATPAAVVGQSMGEIAAAYAAGGLSMEDAVRVAAHRARLMGEGEQQLPEDKQGAMAVVEFGAEELDCFTEEHPEFASIEPAVYAAPGMTTVGGPRKPVQELVEYLEKKGKFARLLDVKGAGHTSMLDPILGELHFEISDIQPHPITVPLYSTVDRGRVYQPGEAFHDADYFVRCTRQPVWFADATGQQFDDGFRTFVEFSPNPVALIPLMNNAFAHNAGQSTLTFILKRKEPAQQSIINLLAQLYVRGQNIDLKALVGSGDYADVPGIHWNNNQYWTNARPSSSPLMQLPGTRVNLPEGTVAYSVSADVVPSVLAWHEAIAADLDPAGVVVASHDHAPLLTSGQLTAVATRTLGGWGVRVYHADTVAMPLLGEAFISSSVQVVNAQGMHGSGAGGATAMGGAIDAHAEATAANAGVTAEAAGKSPVMAAAVSPGEGADSGRWTPSSGVSVHQRLREIVSESMGYEVDDLPGELPLIDLGLDSLMGMRIKNRVEYEFDIPPLQVQALRDGSVDDVIAIVEDMVRQRHGADHAGSLSGSHASEPGEGRVNSPRDRSESPEEQDQREENTQESQLPGTKIAETENAEAAQLTAQATGDTERGVEETSDYTATAGGVAPRDASERLVFATWAKIAGAAAPGVTSPLPHITEVDAAAIAQRLSERSGATITTEDVLSAQTLEPLSAKVRETLETDVQGNIRVLRGVETTAVEKPAPAVFLFHPAGGSSAVYQPLMRRLPGSIPVYGVERLEGPLPQRAAAYLDEIIELSAGMPIILGGWSFGGALAYEVAAQLQQRQAEGQPSATVQRIVLLDTVQPRHPAPNTAEEMHARWDRYAAFAHKTYGIPLEIPHKLLDEQGEGALMQMLEELLQSPALAQMGLPAGVLEHQRASFIDNRILETLDFNQWKQVEVPVTLFRAERMHDGALELEPAYRDIAADGGWAQIVKDLEIIQLRGDHLAIVDEPQIGSVAAVLAAHIQNDCAHSSVEEGAQ